MSDVWMKAFAEVGSEGLARGVCDLPGEMRKADLGGFRFFFLRGF